MGLSNALLLGGRALLATVLWDVGETFLVVGRFLSAPLLGLLLGASVSDWLIDGVRRLGQGGQIRGVAGFQDGSEASA